MNITAFIGSARKKHTYSAAEKFLEQLENFEDIDYEIVPLSNYRLETCKGCITCLDKGAEHCPLKDDRDKLIEKMINSDGVIFATPNYSFQVSGMMKVFLDRLGFFFHRPQFFGKTFTSIVTQGIYGGKDIIKYLDFVGQGLGFNTVKGCCITTREPLPDKIEKKNNEVIKKQANKFHRKFKSKKYPPPALVRLIMFRMSRTNIKIELNEELRDYTYYREKGWFESDYYYPVKLNPFKKAIGKLFDNIAVSMARKN